MPGIDWSDVNGFDLSMFESRHDTAIDALEDIKKTELFLEYNSTKTNLWLKTRGKNLDNAIDLIEADLKEHGYPAPTEPGWYWYQNGNRDVDGTLLPARVVEVFEGDMGNMRFTFGRQKSFDVCDSSGIWGPRVREWTP